MDLIWWTYEAQKCTHHKYLCHINITHVLPSTIFFIGKTLFLWKFHCKSFFSQLLRKNHQLFENIIYFQNPPVCHKNKTKPKVAKTTTYICTGAVESRNICMESLKREQNKSHMLSYHKKCRIVFSVGRLSGGKHGGNHNLYQL